MKICTVCQRYYEDSVVFCAENHGPLTEPLAMAEIFPSDKSLSDSATISNSTRAPQAFLEKEVKHLTIQLRVKIGAESS